MTENRKAAIAIAIAAWEELANKSDNSINVNIYRNTIKALRIQLETGVAVCSCCLKPYPKCEG